ncbi:hypothetical protein BFU36_04250 [Sulfolobus sp. A20]|nr:hypothetical protein BFU36_04250 [Sulfolobus sp. A20]TRM76633.1 hypothetical protein DJ532_07020 [Sulfolobus sp. A20-N-F8]TRM84854.1 hypothetical protein DJ522_03110 [Sulfolobus sp. F3]TRM93797.1 hypothetical protein DJ526_02840 [Sulfolobus sp. A20-N-G8]
MVFKNLELNTSTIYNYANRVVVSIINSILAFRIAYIFININYAYFISAVIAAISFFLYTPMSIVLLLSYLIENAVINKQLYNISLTPLITSYSTEYLILLIISVILLIILPLITFIKYESVNSVITSDSILISLINPFFILFLPFGIAEKNPRKVVNILSTFPILALINKLIFDINNYFLWIFVALTIISGVLLGINKIYSLVGSLTLFLALYLIKLNILASVIVFLASTVINLVPSIVEFVNSKYHIRNEIINKKSSILNEINEIDKTLNMIKTIFNDNTEFIAIIQKYSKMLDNIKSSINSSNSINELSNFEKEFNARKLELERRINDYLFELISEYNDIIEKIKKYGIILERIETPNELIRLNESDIQKIQLISSKISATINHIYRTLNNISNSLKSMLGIDLSKEIKLIDIHIALDYLNIALSEDNIKSCKNCIDMLLKSLQYMNSIEYQSPSSQEILKVIIKISDEKPATFILKAKDVLEQGLEINIDRLNKIIEEYNKIVNEVPLLSKYKSTELLNQIQNELRDNSKPICKRLEIIASSVEILADVMNIIKDKSKIIDVINLVNENYDIIFQKVLEEGCIKIMDLGISINYAKYIELALEEKDSKLRIINDSICYMK